MKRILIKLGGAALHAGAVLENVTEAIKGYRALGYDVVLVHGGGPAINAELQRQGITWTFSGGQRVTTHKMMSVIESVLCGTVNRELIRHFVSEYLQAVGFSGADHGTLMCVQHSAELGQVGTITSVNAQWIEGLLALPSNPLPVIAPIGVGQNGERYNINADWAAAHLAVSLKVEQLLFLTDQSGILDEEGQMIRLVDTDGLNNMIEARTVSGGMLTKARSVLHALTNHVSRVRILNGADAAEAFGPMTLGTTCVLNAPAAREVAYATI